MRESAMGVFIEAASKRIGSLLEDSGRFTNSPSENVTL